MRERRQASRGPRPRHGQPLAGTASAVPAQATLYPILAGLVTRSSAIFSCTLIVALALAASGMAFIAGKAVADPAGAYDRGVAQGERLGRQQARASLRAGDAQYEAIVAEGRRAGLAEGRLAGRLSGIRAGRARAADAAFGAFAGGWDVGRFYVVSITRGDHGARYAIGSRSPVEPGRIYGLCANDPRTVCQRPATTGRRSRSRRTASP
jgi:hypothetical protein